MRQRHRTSQQAFKIINGLCTHPHTLWEGASRRSTVVWLPYYWETSRASPARSNVRLTLKYGMGSRKHLGVNRWKRARKGLLQQGAAGQLQGILN